MKWGLKEAPGEPFDVFVEMDCDFSHPPTDVPRGVQLIEGAGTSFSVAGTPTG